MTWAKQINTAALKIAILKCFPDYAREDAEEYATIWNYTEGKTESRFSLYEYPDFPFQITDRMSNQDIAG